MGVGISFSTLFLCAFIIFIFNKLKLNLQYSNISIIFVEQKR